MVFSEGIQVLVADGMYYQSDRRLISAIKNQIWYVRPEKPGDMDWLPPHNIIQQPSHGFNDYYEYLWYVTASFRSNGSYVLIMDKEQKGPGGELSLLSPIYMNTPTRLADLTRKGVTLAL